MVLKISAASAVFAARTSHSQGLCIYAFLWGIYSVYGEMCVSTPSDPSFASAMGSALSQFGAHRASVELHNLHVDPIQFVGHN